MKPLAVRLATFASILGFFLGSAGYLSAAPEVELMLDGDQLTPSTTLEVRFAREMVVSENLGVPAARSPILLQPKLAGTFTWLSRRSGVFAPTEPPAMETTYTITIAPETRDIAGKPIASALKSILHTPSFGIAEGTKPGTGYDRMDPTPK